MAFDRTSADYYELDALLGDRDHYKLANNTYAHRFDRIITISLHQTTILRFHPNGDIDVNDGGWTTMLTATRMQKLTPERFSFTKMPYGAIAVKDGEEGEWHRVSDVDKLVSSAAPRKGIKLRGKRRS